MSSGWALAVILTAGMLSGVAAAQDTSSGSATTPNAGQTGQSTTTPSGQNAGSSNAGAMQGDQEPQATQSTTPGSTGETQVLIDPGKIYNDKTPTAWIGKPVELRNVMVQDTNDSGNFWVGVEGKHRLLVVKKPDDPNQQALRVKKGDVVNITGVVEPATDEWAQKSRAEIGSMHDARGGAGVFLFANNVSIASSTAK
jgi:hypothetical protein